MSINHHTPGHWSVLMDGVHVVSYEEGPHGAYRTVALAADGEGRIPYAERIGNARVLAAAPDMLAVCRQLVEADETGSHEEWAAAVRAARAIIAQATGAQS